MTSSAITRFLSASVLTALLCTTPAAAASVTATENVRIRSGAGTSYSVISMLYKGDSATKLSSSKNWVRIKTGSIVGYVSADYVTSRRGSSASSTKTRYCTASSLNVRKKASTSAARIGSVSYGKKVTVVSQSNGWSRIKYGDGYGYVSSEYLSRSKPSKASGSSGSSVKIRYCTASSLNVRKKASTSARVIGSLSRKQKVSVVSRKGSWSRIKYGSGYGYVSSEYLSSSKPSGSSASGSSIVAAARRMSDCTYKYGASGPDQYDCSSFTQKAYRDCGITIPRTSIQQYEQCTRVSRSNLRVGDLVFFNSATNHSVCHVGIYTGNGQFIHAANSKRDVCTDSLNSRYYKKHFISGGRY